MKQLIIENQYYKTLFKTLTSNLSKKEKSDNINYIIELENNVDIDDDIKKLNMNMLKKFSAL